MDDMTRVPRAPPLHWWQVPMVWLVVALPASVVIAGSVTCVLAFRGADAPLPTASATTAADAMAPALQGRNHAAGARH